MSAIDELQIGAGEVHTIVADIKWDTETRSKESRTIGGYAAVHNSRSEFLGFGFETLKPGCFRGALNKPGSDQFLLYAHDETRVLARRSAGTLRLSEDAKGLRFEADIVDTQDGRDCLTLARTGHLTKCSFAFRLDPSGSGERWSTVDGVAHRDVLEVADLYEVSLVPTPAYEATSVTARHVRELAEVRAKAKAGRIEAIRERGVYGPGSEHSFFRDFVREQEAKRREEQSTLDPVLRGRDPGEPGFPSATAGPLAEVRARLRTVETRALSTTGGGQGGFEAFMPQNAPADVAKTFSIAARNVSVLPGVLGSEPIPAGPGMQIKVPTFATGASVSTTADNAALSATDPTDTLTAFPIAFIAGYVDVARQVLDRSDPPIDMALGQELGAAIGEQVDKQVVNGTGTSGQVLGLLNVPGTVSVTYTSATPTVAAYWSKLAGVYAGVGAALGYAPDVQLVAIRRHAWLDSQVDSSNRPIDTRPLLPYTEVPATPLNLNNGGTGTEDAAIMLAKDRVHLYLDPVKFRIMDETNSSTMTVRIECWTSMSLVCPQPKAIGKLIGSGTQAIAF